MTNLVETVSHDDKILAHIIRSQARAEKTTFVTDPADAFQLGFIVYPKGGRVPNHFHKPISRNINTTSEAILVRTGCCELDLFSDPQTFVATVSLNPGDIVLLLSGGHGFRMMEDCVLLEVKQGPYSGVDEKERFT